MNSNRTAQIVANSLKVDEEFSKEVEREIVVDDLDIKMYFITYVEFIGLKPCI
jgi:hypothetical protein